MLGVPWQPNAAPRPQWLIFNRTLATQLGLNVGLLEGDEGLAVFSGQALPTGAQPMAQAYAGHQFGGFSPQLGDGRALLLGELITKDGLRLDMAFKGSGRTPFARGGDGKAAMGPMLREYIISEAMHALGVPTTRTLAVVATGESVQRDRALPGAVMCRIAASHLRVGTFEFVATRSSQDTLQALIDYTLQRHYPNAQQAHTPALTLLQAVVDAQASLLARWMGVGFIHGVMNTDNMTLSGETIDYGPCAFMEAHDPQAVFSSIDHHGRYAYGNQPHIAQWNLARFAETLLPCIDADSDQAQQLAIEALQTFSTSYARRWLEEFRAKLGLNACEADSSDLALIQNYLRLLQDHRIDHTLGFRYLSDVLREQPDRLVELFEGATEPLNDWLDRWQQRLQMQHQPMTDIAQEMDQHNPWVIPRNHRVEAALSDATQAGNMQTFQRLLDAVTHPYDPPEDWADAQAAPLSYTQSYQTFCGT